jgi:hypothetical protein
MPTQDLIDERRYTMQILRSAEDMLSAPSFAARVKIYCRDQIYASRSRVSVEEVEARYAKLMRTEPSTKEEEVQRQYKLQAFRETLAADHENVSVCQGAITAGYQGLLLTSRSAKKPASPESV